MSAHRARVATMRDMASDELLSATMHNLDGATPEDLRATAECLNDLLQEVLESRGKAYEALHEAHEYAEATTSLVDAARAVNRVQRRLRKAGVAL